MPSQANAVASRAKLAGSGTLLAANPLARSPEVTLQGALQAKPRIAALKPSALLTSTAASEVHSPVVLVI